MALQRVEALAREHGAREILGRLGIPESHTFFEQRGYQIRKGPQGDHDISKSLTGGERRERQRDEE